MSIVPDRFDFLNPVHKLLSQEALAVPLHDSSVKETQEFKMNVNDRYYLFTPDRQTYGHFIVKQWLHKSGDAPTRVVLEDMQYGAQLYLSHFQIAHLNANNQIRPVSVSEKDNRGAVPGSALTLTKEELQEPKRRAAYLDAITKACNRAGLYQYSRKIIKRVIVEVAEKRGEKPPSVPTVYRWLGKQEDGRYFDRMLALAPLPRPGNNRRMFARRVEEMVSLAIQDACSGSKGTWLSVDARIRKLCGPDGEYTDLGWMFKDGKFQMSDRTVQRRLADLDHFTRDFLTYGPEFAERKHASRARIERPTRPLDVVDVDHTELDIVVIDDENPIAFGRPDLLTFRDRHSGVAIGFELSFGPPSFDIFLSGLRNAMFPKRPEDLPEGVDFPWYGRPSKIGVDNAWHFIGHDIQNAAVQLGFQTVEYRPGHPHEKGAEEHLFHLTNQDLVHRLPGTTTGSIDERKMFDEIKQKGVPILTLQEVRSFLYRYFAEIHNRRAHAGLGHTARAKGVPADLWEKGIALSEPVVPVDEEIFVRLAGNCKYLTIQQYGIQWSHIIYQDAALQAILLHPHHKKGRKYKVIRDPKNLGHVWVHDPYSNRIYLVRATPSDEKYAKGLSKFQHEKVMQYHLKHNKAIEDASALYESMVALQNELMDLHALRKKHNTARKLARFLSANGKRLQYTRTIEVEPMPEGGGRINLEAPSMSPKRTPPSNAMVSEPETNMDRSDPDDETETSSSTTSGAVDKIDDTGLQKNAVGNLAKQGIFELVPISETTMLVRRSSFEAFDAKYANAQIYLAHLNCSPSNIRVALDAVGINPVFDPPDGPLGGTVVDRAEARAILGLKHDPDQDTNATCELWEALKDTLRRSNLPYAVQATFSGGSAKIATTTNKVVCFARRQGDAFTIEMRIHPKRSNRRFLAVMAHADEIRKELPWLDWQEGEEGDVLFRVPVHYEADIDSAITFLGCMHRTSIAKKNSATGT